MLQRLFQRLFSPKDDQNHDHHHAPDPVQVQGELAQGILEIIDTPDGERMRFTALSPLSNISVALTIERESGEVETLVLLPASDSVTVLISDRAPDEPHEFSAQLHLESGDRREVLPLCVYEPHDHDHT